LGMREPRNLSGTDLMPDAQCLFVKASQKTKKLRDFHSSGDRLTELNCFVID
jgi:hypothetical protein